MTAPIPSDAARLLDAEPNAEAYAGDAEDMIDSTFDGTGGLEGMDLIPRAFMHVDHPPEEIKP